MSDSNAPGGTHIGFLTVFQEPSGYLGGYLVTNMWGRPLEFRLSTAVQPNRVQQILYGETLQSYLCADLIGKTLVDKTATQAQLLVTDTEAALDLRLRLGLPVVLVRGDAEKQQAASAVVPLVAHARFPDDAATARQLLDRSDGSLDLTEPFARIREAIAEARRMGVTGRN